MASDDGDTRNILTRSRTRPDRNQCSTTTVGDDPATAKLKSKTPNAAALVTMDDFLAQIGLSRNYYGIFEGVSCEELVKMPQPELSTRILKWIPYFELDKVESGIVQLRQCIAPSKSLELFELPEDFPDLETYLKDHGIADYFICELKKHKFDMRKFLDSTSTDLSKFIHLKENLEEVDKCRIALQNDLQRRKSSKTDEEGKDSREDVKQYLDSIHMGKHLEFFKERNVDLGSVQSISLEELKDMGMSDVEANIFVLSRTISTASSVIVSTRNSANFGKHTTEHFGTLGKQITAASYADVSKDTAHRMTVMDQCKIQPSGTDSGPLNSKQNLLPREIDSFGNPACTKLQESNGSHNTIKCNSGISAETFFKQHGFSISPVGNSGNSQHSSELNTMDVSEIRKLAVIAMQSYQGLQAENDDLKRQLSALSGATPTISALNGNLPEVEHMEVDDNNEVQDDGESTARSQSIPSTSGGFASTNVQREVVPEPFVPREALNILLLGETGVGKSTFINSFANYVNYETLDEARRKKMLALIPASFSLSDDNYVDHKVSIGSPVEAKTRNECLSGMGQSSTQSCKSYVFPSKQGAIRIIDTPGVGDTRGLDQDSLNFANILSYISQYPELHAICILLKPNNAKLTAGFRLCLNQLLNNLEKSASQNIIFIFTNARSTFYQPGDTKPVLEKVLQEVENNPPFIRIKFDHSTSYCVDNEAFRFLAAISSGLDFLEPDSETFAESWSKSVGECRRLIEHIMTLKSHKVQDTVSIGEARRLIDELANPVADIIAEISMNMTRIKEQQEFLERNRSTNESLESLKGKLFTSDVEIDYELLPMPQTVCGFDRCIELDPNGEIIYRQICHKACLLENNSFSTGNMGDPALKNCVVFSGGYYCGVCRCKWNWHVRQEYKKVWREVVKEDLEVKKLLRNATSINEAVSVFQSNLDSFVRERKLLLDTMAFFTVFQSKNSITGRGDPFQDCLEGHIRMAEFKNRAGVKNEKVIRKLRLALSDYDATKDKLSSQRDEKDSMKLTAENVVKYEKTIYDLPLHGSKLRKLRDTVQRGRVKDVIGSSETVVELTNVSGSGTTSILQPVDSYFARK